MLPVNPSGIRDEGDQDRIDNQIGGQKVTFRPAKTTDSRLIKDMAEVAYSLDGQWQGKGIASTK